MTNLRPAITQHLQQRLQAFAEGFRQNLALLGPPGSGKTYQLQRLLSDSSATGGSTGTSSPAAALLLIYCPVHRESCGSFLRRFLTAVLRGALDAPGIEGAAERMPGHASGSLEPLLRDAERVVPKTAAVAREAEALVGRGLYAEAFTRALETVHAVTEERRCRCVLMLDEFLLLEDLGLAHAYHELGKRVMTWPATLFILSSSAPSRARRILRERLQLLFGQFELLSVDAPHPRDAERWVRQELKGLRGVRGVERFLIQWLGSYPRYLDIFLKRLKELARLGGSPRVDPSLVVQTAWDVIGQATGSLHQWCASRVEGLTRVRHGPRALEALMQMARGARTVTEVGRRIGRSNLSGVLQVLSEEELAQRSGMCWVIHDPVLRCWLSAVLWVQRSTASLSEGAAQSLFNDYVERLWHQWHATCRIAFSTQVAGLLSRFGDETVSLDQKVGRLPRFQRIVTQAEQNGTSYLIAEGEGKRWCCSTHEEVATEQGIAAFDEFCKQQALKPSRKVVVTKAGLDDNAKVMAKAANMWVWGGGELDLLWRIYEDQGEGP